MDEPVEPASVLRFEPGQQPRYEPHQLLPEAPLTIRLPPHPDIALMRTPGSDRELVVGFLLTEGFIRTLADIATLEVCEDAADRIGVTLLNREKGDTIPHRVPLFPAGMLVASSCGLCGRERIDALLSDIPPLEDHTRFPVGILFDAPGRMREAQALFKRTGASHAAALFDTAGNLLVVREDIGRHNALDKAIGHAVLTRRSLADCGAMLSGRASFEMVAKAARAGLPLVAAVSAPSALAVEAAEHWNVTLCGFCRGADVTCYAHAERLTQAGQDRRDEPGG